MFYDQTEPQSFPKHLLQVSVIELYNSVVCDPNDGGIKDARSEDDNFIISDSTLRSLLPLQFEKKSSRYKVICGCECWICAKSVPSSLIP